MHCETHPTYVNIILTRLPRSEGSAEAETQLITLTRSRDRTMNYCCCYLSLWFASLLHLCTGADPCTGAEPQAAARKYDIVVYGGTSAGVIAAVEAKRLGKSVAIVCPETHLGGLTAGGLGWTDTGNKAVIGGLAREFYHRVWQHYQQSAAWKWQTRDEYGNRGQGTAAIDGKQRTMWIFEPHIAEQVFEELIDEYQIPVFRDQWLDRQNGVLVKAGRIQSIQTLDGQSYEANFFIDAGYEGDLLAAAGISYHVGREANDVYNETWNGVQVGVLHHSHHFKNDISPYRVAGDPTSGLLPRISPDPPGIRGEGDQRIQAYCYRLCMTNHEPNRIPFEKPEGYDPYQYELLLRVLDNGWREIFNKFDPIPNHKTDTNNHGPFSTDNIGMNYDYPEAGYQRRREILAEHELYQKGLLYFMANDPRVPEDVRTRVAEWGLAADEFRDNGGWPHQIYVREARRMIGEYVMTEHDCLDRKSTPSPIGMGSYTLDSHNVQRYVKPDGYVQNEGDIGVHVPRPYEVSYGSLVPKQNECENLLVPVCVSSSHIAFGSIRMEPVFMILGHSAAAAASLAQDLEVAVQDVPYDRLRALLHSEGQVLDLTEMSRSMTAELPGVVVDDLEAEVIGQWSSSSANQPYVGLGYRHDGDAHKGESAAVFRTALKPGDYDVRIAFPRNNNRATNVPVTIRHAGGESETQLNQRTVDQVDNQWMSLGVFSFASTGEVRISNQGTDGHVIIDAVQWLPVAK